MLYAIVSDIHANPVALTRVLAECDRVGVGRVVCAGDVVGYGPDPVGAVRILRERNIPSVMGNHDAVAVGLRDGNRRMLPGAMDAVRRHGAELGGDDIDWLRSLPLVYETDGFAVAHARFDHPEKMEYVMDRMDARPSFICREERLLFVGHTHAATMFAFGVAENQSFPVCVQAAEPMDFRMAEGWSYLVNVGSVGYPRVHPHSSFVTYDSEAGKVEFHRVDFDFRSYAESLRAKSMSVPPWVVSGCMGRG